MPPISYDDSPGTYYEGQIVYPLEDNIIRTGINFDSVILPFGRLACLDETATGDGTRLPIILPDDANAIPRGILVKTDTFEKREGYSLNAEGDMGYPLNHQLAYMVKGTIAVYTDVAITPDDDVFWIHTAYTGAKVGQFRNDANTDKAVQLTGAKWLALGGPGIVPLSIDL